MTQSALEDFVAICVTDDLEKYAVTIGAMDFFHGSS